MASAEAPASCSTDLVAPASSQHASIASPTGAGAESLPYLLRAASATVRASEHVAAAMDTQGGDPETLEAIRDAALSVSVMDRLLTEFVREIAKGMSLPVRPQAGLAELADALAVAPPHIVKKLPPGGIVSLLYHIVIVMEDTANALLRLSVSRWDNLSTYVFPTLALGVYLMFRLTRLRQLRLRRLSAFLLGAAFLRVYLALNGRLSARARLQRANAQMLIVLRMWVLAAETFHAANIDRNASYNVMLSELSEQDFRESAKPLARRILEKTSLPRGAAMWPNQGLAFAALKRGMDTVYAVLEPVYSLLRASNALPVPLSWLPAIASVPVGALAGAYYVASPGAAAERASRVLAEADVGFIKFVWCLTDGPVFRYLSQRLLMPRLTVNRECDVAGTTCHVLANVEWERLRLESGEVAPSALEQRNAASSPAPSIRAAGADSSARRSRPPLAPRVPGPMTPGAQRTHDAVLRRAASAGSDRLHAESSTSLAAQAIAEADEEDGGAIAESASHATAALQSVSAHDAARVTAGTGSALSLDDMRKSKGPGEASAPPAAAAVAALLSPSPAVDTDAGDVPILFYIHGGGFVGSMSVTDNLLLSRWVAKSPTPMCSVYLHYTLSPEARFPTALNQAFDVYRRLRARSRRVVVAGDSAGGNLSAALCLKCIKEGVPVPSALVLCYPALCLNSSPSPSRALHINDPLVPVHLLEKLAAAYFPEAEMGGGGDSSANLRDVTPHAAQRLRGRAGSPGRSRMPVSTNPLMHPLYCSDDDLRCFPTTHIINGGLDPLLDDSIDFNTRLRRLGVPGDLQVFRALPHGFLMFEFLSKAGAAIEVVRRYVMEGLGITEDGTAGRLPATSSASTVASAASSIRPSVSGAFGSPVAAPLSTASAGPVAAVRAAAAGGL